MLDHHIQKTIIARLAQLESARFSGLKPDDIENKLFDYHLKKVISAGFVEKLEDGSYGLTVYGRRVGKDAIKPDPLADTAVSVVFMAVRRQSDGAWLFCRRKAQPLLDRTGFLKTLPDPHKSLLETASLALHAQTGLHGEFLIRGSGYLRFMDGNELESFTHFTLVECRNVTGELRQRNDSAECFWQLDPDFGNATFLQSIGLLASKLEEPGLFFIEKQLELD